MLDFLLSIVCFFLQNTQTLNIYTGFSTERTERRNYISMHDTPVYGDGTTFEMNLSHSKSTSRTVV